MKVTSANGFKEDTNLVVPADSLQNQAKFLDFSPFSSYSTEVDFLSPRSSIDSWSFQDGSERSFSSCKDARGNKKDMVFYRMLKSLFTRNLLEMMRKFVLEIYQGDVKLASAAASAAQGDLSSSLSMTLLEDGKILLCCEGFRTRIFEVVKRCIANSTEVNIVQIYVALREKYNIIQSSAFPSAGSIVHATGHCKACVFASKKTNSCKSGFDCNFCHYHHKIVRRKPGQSWEQANLDKKFTKAQSWNSLTAIGGGYSLDMTGHHPLGLDEDKSSKMEDLYKFSRLVISDRQSPRLLQRSKKESFDFTSGSISPETNAATPKRGYQAKFTFAQ